MALELILAGLLAATSQVPAGDQTATLAPPGTPTTRYCLKVDPLPGSKIETVECMTREEWANLEIDVDAEWAANGVRVIA
jgi:hypothetical protein